MTPSRTAVKKTIIVRWPPEKSSGMVGPTYPQPLAELEQVPVADNNPQDDVP